MLKQSLAAEELGFSDSKQSPLISERAENLTEKIPSFSHPLYACFTKYKVLRLTDGLS